MRKKETYKNAGNKVVLFVLLGFVALSGWYALAGGHERVVSGSGITKLGGAAGQYNESVRNLYAEAGLR